MWHAGRSKKEMPVYSGVLYFASDDRAQTGMLVSKWLHRVRSSLNDCGVCSGVIWRGGCGFGSGGGFPPPLVFGVIVPPGARCPQFCRLMRLPRGIGVSEHPSFSLTRRFPSLSESENFLCWSLLAPSIARPEIKIGLPRDSSSGEKFGNEAVSVPAWRPELKSSAREWMIRNRSGWRVWIRESGMISRWNWWTNLFRSDGGNTYHTYSNGEDITLKYKCLLPTGLIE